MLENLYFFMKTNLKKLEKSQIEVEFELSQEEFSKYVDKALEHLKSHVKMDGFRQGQVPKDIIEKKVGQENLLMEAGDLAVRGSYEKFVEENNLETIGQPEASISKITRGSEFLFKVKVPVLPEIILPDYKEIAKGVKSKEISVGEKEVEDSLNYLQKSRAKFSQIERPAENKDFVEIEYKSKDVNEGKAVKDQFILGEGGFMKDFEDNLVEMKSGEEKEFASKFPENHPDKNLAGKESQFNVKVISVQKMELPEISDEFAKQLGDFKDLPALKESIKEGITIEKEEMEKHRKRNEILEKISAKISFDMPENLVLREKEKMFEDLKNQITSNFKMEFDNYLASIKKTEEEIKESFKLEAEKRIRNFLIVREIGKKENIEVLPEEVEKEVNELLTHNPSYATKGKFDIQQLKEYSKGVIYNEKVFQLLEKFSQ